MAHEDKPKKMEDDSFLASIDTQIAALRELRDVYLKARSLGVFGKPGGPPMPTTVAAALYGGGGNDGPVDLPTGAFLNMSIPEAIKVYLTAARRKQTIREIATALKEGGVESTASNFEGPVNGALYRLKTTGDVLRFKDGWALADFYPDSLRARIEKDAKPKKAKRSKRSKVKARAAKQTAREADTKPRRGMKLSGPIGVVDEKAG